MDSRIIKPLIDSTARLFDTMLGMTVTPGKPRARNGAAPYELSAIISLTGDVEANVILSFSIDTVKTLLAAMTGMPAPESRADIADGAGELVNIVAGGAKSALAERNVGLSCPTVVIGKEHDLRGGHDLAMVEIPCTCDAGPLSIQVLFRVEAGTAPAAPAATRSKS